MRAATAAYAAFTSEHLNAQAKHAARADRSAGYNVAWAYYKNKMFAKGETHNFRDYITARELYTHTRLIYNPVPNVIDFYVDHIWNAARDDDDNPRLATPVKIESETKETLVNAVAQIDQWTNWLSEQVRIKRYAAATGGVLIEILDDRTREKVTQKTIWAGYVSELNLSDAGDVLSYALEYEVYDRKLDKTYRYKKVVTKETFSYFFDDKPFTPDGKTASVEDNPYKFCPAVWIKHADDGAAWGVGAFDNLAKVDEINSLASHLHDNIHKAIESAKIIAADKVIPIIGSSQNDDGTMTTFDPRSHWVVFQASQGASVHDLAGDLSLLEANPFLREAIASLTDDYPELSAHSVIKQNSQLSGAALERMLAPAQARLDRAAANYNQQLIKLRQMQIAIAGWRTQNGWTRKTTQQQIFNSFGLDSYESGELDFYLKQSLLVQSTEDEREDLLTKRANRAVVLSAIVDRQEALRIADYSEAAAAEILDRTPKIVPPTPPENESE